jgi:glycosyltransferase involved in cell wall biosynthesis
MTGYAYITERMIETLAMSADVTAINLSPGDRQGIRKHLHKALQTARACSQIIGNTNRLRFIYLGCEGDWGLIYTVVLVVVSRLLGHLIFLHHHSFSYLGRRSTLMRAISTAGAGHIQHIFLCATMRDAFEGQYGKSNSTYIVSNAAFVDQVPEQTPFRDRSSRLRIGLLSNLTREKGLHTFLQLLRSLKDSSLEIEGILAGPIAKSDDKERVAAAERELGGALRYIGPVYGEEKARFYRDIDVFVFPTEYANEAQPTVLFEALAAGNHVIAFARGCIADQIATHGIAIPTSEDFCEAAVNYLRSLALEHEAGSLMRSSAARQFTDMHQSALRLARSLLESA